MIDCNPRNGEVEREMEETLALLSQLVRKSLALGHVIFVRRLLLLLVDVLLSPPQRIT